jgi:hypothetical protein
VDATPIASLLQTLEDELFFAILDVALDIDQELVISEGATVYIPVRRLAIRYELLCPLNNPGAIDRYCQLRWKACLLLKKQMFISSVEYREQGTHRWEGLLEVTVPNPPAFAELLVELRSEENRRSPEEKMETDIHSATARLVQLADSFDRVAVRLRDRRAGREPLLIRDEYDVQYVIAAMLETRFDDIRPEEWGPSYAGKATRVDFFLKNECVLFETKMTRDGLTDAKLGEELIIDITHYKQRPDCKALVCFVYDPDHRLKNPRGLENDLSRQHDHLSAKVIVRPR